MAIHVLSLDFDGCLFNTSYTDKLQNDLYGSKFDSYDTLFSKSFIAFQEKNLVNANKSFLDLLKADNLQYTKNIAFIGSNRQSTSIDRQNAFARYCDKIVYKGSCFPAIKTIADCLGINFDTFLLADIYGNLPHGTSYQRAMNPDEKQHADWLFDETKVSLLYAQMHKVALENQKNEIIFDFYDDRRDIHDSISTFYQKYIELVPPNVTLRLNHYDGKEVTPFGEIIKGKPTSCIDANYYETVKDMAAAAIKAEPWKDGINQAIRVAPHVTPELLEHRVAFKAIVSSSSTPAVAPSAQPGPLDTIFSVDSQPIALTSSQGSPLVGKNNVEDGGAKARAQNPVFFSQPITVKFPKSYTDIWDDSNSTLCVNGKDPNIENIKALLKDYTKEDSIFGSLFGRIFTGHWNRHHVDEVHNIVETDYDSVNELLIALRAINPAIGGSLIRRIHFIEDKISAQPQEMLSLNR